jgi:hypothetical protein
MHFAIPQEALPQDTLPTGHSADRPEPSAARQRAGTTAVLLGMVLCVVAMKTHSIETPASTSHQAAQNGVAAPAKIIAPEFCKDQTWPYIDSRCLRRVDNPAPPAAPPRIVTPPATTAAAAPAASNVTANNTVSASTTDGKAAPSAATNHDDNATPPAPASPATPAPAPASPAASASNPPDPRMQVMQSVFPTTTPGAASESGATRNDVASYQHTGDSSQHHRSWNHHSNFFGFHF